MIKKNTIIKIEDRDTFLWNKNNFESIKNVNVDLKNRNLYLIVEGERVYIKLLNLPKVSKDKLYKMIEYQLKYYFTDMEDILFDYYICKKLKKSYEIMVFCINSRKINNLHGLLEKGTKLKLVNLIQFVILNYVKNYVDDKEYTLLFENNRNVYIMAIKNDILVDNSMIRDFTGDFQEFFLEFSPIIENQLMDIENNKVYVLWFEYEDILKELERKYKLVILDYKEKNIIENFTKDWKYRICIK